MNKSWITEYSVEGTETRAGTSGQARRTQEEPERRGECGTGTGSGGQGEHCEVTLV